MFKKKKARNKLRIHLCSTFHKAPFHSQKTFKSKELFYTPLNWCSRNERVMGNESSTDSSHDFQMVRMLPEKKLNLPLPSNGNIEVSLSLKGRQRRRNVFRRNGCVWILN